MEYILMKHNNPVYLLHLTTEDRIENIQKNGLLASTYGDLAVDDNDGAGIYAIRPQKKAADALINEWFSPFGNDRIFAICFRYSGPYFECMGSVPEEFDDEYGFDENSHKGFIVIPWDGNGSRLRIDPENFIGVVPVDDLRFKVLLDKCKQHEKPALETQIQSASTRAAVTKSSSHTKDKNPEPEF